jgi:arginase
MRTRKRREAAKRIALLGVPMDLGADLRGVDMGPSAIRIAGLTERLCSLGFKVKDLGNLTVPHAIVAGGGGGRAKYAKPIREVCGELAEAVEAALGRGARPLVLGGDHAIAMGSIAGLTRFGRRRKKRYGLLWVDAHGDCNTPATTPSGNIHGMSLAVALGRGESSLIKLAGVVPMIDPARTVLLGVRKLDREERENMRAIGLRVITMREIDEQGVHASTEEALRVVTSDTDGFHLSFDVDCLDPRFAPGVGTPASGGLTGREAHLIMEMVADSGRMVSCELVEVNPVLDTRNTTAELAAYLLYSAFGGRIF